ncbi:MAG: AI-2E family transporter [Rhodoferax sp.]|nr:AI-2E family transporter [Rhodoferax sp.]
MVTQPILVPTGSHRAFSVLLALVTLALGYILLPFYGAILWGVIVALLFAPLNQWLLPKVRQQRTVAALLTLLIVLVIVVLPLAAVATALASEAALVYARLQSGELNPALYFRGVFDALPSWITAVLDRFGLVSFNTLQRRLTAALTQGTQFIATHTFSVGQNTFDFFASFFITLYLAFFLIRDGQARLQPVWQTLPLAAKDKEQLLQTFVTAVRATVKGNLLVAIIQGALGGLAFWALGVSGALLWAVLMAFMSLLPAVGAGLVWLPVAVWLVLTGSLWQGLALGLYGVLVIGLVDNLLRPILIGRNTHLPDYIVLITTLGGMAVFGLNGFVLGPVIAAMFIAVWHIHIAQHMAADTPRLVQAA